MHLGRVDDARRILTGGIDYSRAIESTIWLAHQLWALGHLELARTLLVTGGILRRAGRRRDAAARLAEAKSQFGVLRSPLWLARVDAEERRLGGRRRSSDVLTPTEERVAGLAGQGLRNAEIATRLHVTPKTVEATLSRVYRKLGVRSRTELARHLAERSPA
jgi:DNA-binding CsgD family transcriptional regulator